MSQQPNATFSTAAPLHGVLGKENTLAAGAISPTNALFSSQENSQPNNIAFVDAGLSDIDTLIQGLENTQIVLLNTKDNGIETITTTLAQYNNLAGVYIFSHGTNGSLQLGNAALNNGTLSNNNSGYANQLQQWQNALSPNADLLLYGCDLVAGADGLALIHRISQLTGADVAASNDLTGIGGDWRLEVSIGDIESESVLSASAQNSYSGTLELLANGDFEAATLANWSPFTGTESVSTTEAFTGSQSLQLAAATSGVAQIFDATVGTAYTLTGDAKSSSSGYVGVGINFFDENFNVAGSSGQQITGNSWTRYRAEGTAPEGTRYVQVWAYKDNANGDVFIDNLVLETDAVTPPAEPPATGEELLNNIGFETGLAGWSQFNNSEAVSSAEAFAGGNSLQLSTANSGIAQIVDAVVGADYVLSAYGKSSSNDYAGFGINFFDADYNSLEGGVGNAIASTDWQRYQSTATAPLGTRYIQVWTYKSGAAGDAFFDEISLSIDGTTEPPVDTTAPTATLSADNITDTASNYTFSVTYADDTAIDVSTLDNNDIRVTGPNGFSQTATFVSASEPSDGQPRTATYRITAPGGSWDSTNSGTYSVRLLAGQVADTAGNTTSATTLGTFTNEIDPPVTDTTGPSATVTAGPLTTAGTTIYNFNVTYTDATAVDVSSLGNTDLRVTGPNGFDQIATFVSVDAPTDGTPRTGTYRISAPNSAWQEADNGTYTIRLRNNQVQDTLGNGAAALNIGTFEVNVEATPVIEPGFLGLQTSTITVDEDAGSATVTVLRTGGSDGAVSVDYNTVTSSGRTATPGEDFTASSGTLTFADGETSKSVLIPILNDTLAEGPESFGFAIDNIQGGATLLAPRTAQVTITDDDGASYNGNTYLLTSGSLTWAQAQAEAESLGGNLVSVNSAAEETWLKQTFGTAEGFWLGLNDVASEGQFVWASGDAVTYTNWAPGQPNNFGGNQDYGWMNFGASKQWDDNEPTSQLRGIIEIGDFNGGPGDPNPPGGGEPIAETVITGLNSPTAIDWRPNSNQVFIAEKGGKVEIFENGNLLATPFIDISDQVNGVRDRGLLDIAIHPDFINNPYVYLLFTYDPPEVFNNTGNAGPDGINNRAGRLIRVTADASNNYRTAVAGSEVILLGKNSTWDNFNGFVNSTNDFTEPEAGRLPNGDYLEDFLNADSESHTVGSVEFGPDGALYVSNGDGTSYNQVDRRTARVQDIDSLSGKVLRIDPITGEGLADNPFYNGNANANRSKVYQLGLRNPFRMAIDERNGQLYIGDVGWTLWEEINAAGAGANFGWPYYEGGNGVSTRTGGYSTLPEAQAFYNSGTTVTPSLLGLNHATDGINAIVMGDIYTGSVYDSQYQGDIFFNDLGQGIVRHASLDAAGNVTDVSTFVTDAAFVVQMVEGPDELLYYVNLVQGTVGRWVFS